MNNEIKNSYLRGRLAILLGAGASITSNSANGVPIPLGLELAAELAEKVGLPYEGESLQAVYSAAVNKNQSIVLEMFSDKLTNGHL